jgi:hypothetical protein
MCDVYRGVTCNCLVVGCRCTDGSRIGTSSTNWWSNQQSQILEKQSDLTVFWEQACNNICKEHLPVQDFVKKTKIIAIQNQVWHVNWRVDSHRCHWRCITYELWTGPSPSFM